MDGGGVTRVQGYRLELGSEEKEGIENMKELAPHLRGTEVQLRCKAKISSFHLGKAGGDHWHLATAQDTDSRGHPSNPEKFYSS